MNGFEPSTHRILFIGPASTLNHIPKRYYSLQVVLWVVHRVPCYLGLTNKGDPGDGGPVPAFRASLVPLQKYWRPPRSPIWNYLGPPLASYPVLHKIAMLLTAVTRRVVGCSTYRPIKCSNSLTIAGRLKRVIWNTLSTDSLQCATFCYILESGTQ